MNEIKQIVIDIKNEEMIDLTIYFEDSNEPWGISEFEENSLMKKELQTLSDQMSFSIRRYFKNKR